MTKKKVLIVEALIMVLFLIITLCYVFSRDYNSNQIVAIATSVYAFAIIMILTGLRSSVSSLKMLVYFLAAFLVFGLGIVFCLMSVTIPASISVMAGLTVVLIIFDVIIGNN